MNSHVGTSFKLTQNKIHIDDVNEKKAFNDVTAYILRANQTIIISGLT